MAKGPGPGPGPAHWARPIWAWAHMDPAHFGVLGGWGHVRFVLFSIFPPSSDFKFCLCFAKEVKPDAAISECFGQSSHNTFLTNLARQRRAAGAWPLGPQETRKEHAKSM